MIGSHSRVVEQEPKHEAKVFGNDAIDVGVLEIEGGRAQQDLGQKATGNLTKMPSSISYDIKLKNVFNFN